MLQFEKEVEINNLYSTSEPDQIQIIAKDIAKSILFIVTWDLIKNIEVSMLQIRTDPATSPENYIIKGMNQRMNYFITQH